MAEPGRRVELRQRAVRHGQRRRTASTSSCRSRILSSCPDLSIASLRMPGKPRHRDRALPESSAPTRSDTSLQAFDKYYRGRPALDDVEITNYPTQRNAWTAHDARRHRHALRGQPRRRGRSSRPRRTIKTYSFPAPVLQSSRLQRAPSGPQERRGAPRAQRGARPGHADPRRPERTGPAGRRPAAGPSTGPTPAAGAPSRSTPTRRDCGSTRRDCKVQPGVERHGCPAGSRSPAWSSRTIRDSSGWPSWCRSNSPTSASTCSWSRCRCEELGDARAARATSTRSCSKWPAAR